MTDDRRQTPIIVRHYSYPRSEEERKKEAEEREARHAFDHDYFIRELLAAEVNTNKEKRNADDQRRT